MKTSSRTFVLAALAGLSVFMLSQAPAQAQYRRPVGAPFVPYRPVRPRVVIATPPLSIPYSQSYMYVPSGLSFGQVAGLNGLRIQTQMYRSMYAPNYVNPYTMYPYTTPAIPYYTPGNPYNPYLP